MQKSSWLPFKYIPPAILAVSLLAVYLNTMAPGLTWVNDGADGGDLITAAATGGVAHPTGYPVYIVLARIFQWLPIGSLAFRTNLMSALAAVIAAVLLYALILRSLASQNWLVALISGFAFGLSPLIWSQAVITEVHALQSLLVVLSMCVFALEFSSERHADILRGLTLGLAMGNHITAILLAPVIILGSTIQRTGSASWRKWLVNWRALLRQLTAMALALLVYLILPLRASSTPPVNWGNPVTVDRLWWLVSGRLYQANLLLLTAGDVWLRTKAWASLLLQQFGLVGLILALIGLVYSFRLSRLYAFTLWAAIVYSVFSIAYGSFDSYIYLVSVYISFAVWLGLGLDCLINQSVGHGYRTAISVSVLVYLFVLAAYHWPQVDASHDARAETFGREMLASAPPGAILFAKGDQAVFALWYFHFALRERSDLVVIATDLLHFDWYQETLRSTYPSLVLNDPYPWSETVLRDNPSLPACYVQYREQAVMECVQTTSAP